MKFLYLYVFISFSSVFGQSSYQDQLDSSRLHLSKDTSNSSFAVTLHYELVNKIIPYWYGTSWDYNGYTNVPREGSIACGYFVSTTLKHLGFNLNRYDIAKMYSSDIVKILCFNDFWISNDWQTFLDKMKSEPDGIYIIGLSNHVGFIERSKGRTYFIHSNYLGNKGVEKELADQSKALSYSTIFWLGNFSNSKLVKRAFFEGIQFKKVDDK